MPVTSCQLITRQVIDLVRWASPPAPTDSVASAVAVAVAVNWQLETGNVPSSLTSAAGMKSS
ncbi:MAG: hypothetical protein WD031_03470, partial [Gemmatimonadota bacterium]